MAFINGIEVDEDTGRCVVVIDGSPASEDPYRTGLRFLNDETNALYVVNTVVAIDATFQDGWARDEEGGLYVLIDDPPTGDDAVFNDGVLCDISGRVSLTTVNPIAGYSHGWPVDEDGSVCIIGTTPPPPTFQTFDTLIIDALNEEQFVIIDNLYFGTATDGGGYTQIQANFLADNPGLSLQTFEGFVADGAILPQSAFTGFTCTDPTPFGDPVPAIAGKAVLPSGGTPTAVYLSQNLGGQLVFTFSPVISAVGCNLASGTSASSLSFTVKDGATVLTTQSATTASYNTMAAFAGYASDPVTPSNTRITADSDTRVTADGDTRVWV